MVYRILAYPLAGLDCTEIDPNKQTVTHSVGIETKEGKDVGIFGGIGSKYHRPYGSGKEEYYVENLLEEIDQPGEWCIDFTTQKLYLFPPEHFDEKVLYQTLPH